MTNKKNRKKLIVSLSILSALCILIISSFIYLCTYYHADESIPKSNQTIDDISITYLDNKNILVKPNEPKIGFIFYPGGKVEHSAYIPLMYECAKNRLLCVIVKMPFNLAVFNSNAADDIPNQYPQLKKWIIGGHSLGGAMGANFLAKNHKENFHGVVLLGAYATKDISQKGIPVLSIYGSEDEILNKQKYEKYRSYLPTNFTEKIIEGGCHSYFGNYGMQSGDGTPTISSTEQKIITASEIKKFIDANS